MAIRIITDSASDITREELNAWQVGLIPMPLQCDGETYIDDKTIPTDTFWQMLLEGKTIMTSQPAPETFIRVFEDAREAGDTVICILISSALSGTYQGALAARTLVGYEQVYIIDAQEAAAAAAEKMLVREACRLRDAGELTGLQIAAELKRFRSRIRLFACIDTLEYLARGGRLSKTAASLGGLMQVKPMITLSQSGEIEVLKKVRGAQHAMRQMCAKTLSYCVDNAYPVIPIYAYDGANCREFLEKLGREGFQGDWKEPEPIGATIGAYIGPGGYGIVFVEA